jgi:hypothetical protein
MAEIDGDRLDEREVLLTTTTLIMAGVESLGGFMMMFAYNLATEHEAQAACVANPALLPDAVEESLRFNTSAQRFRRRLMKDVTLHGQTMKAGDFVCLAYGSGNRDERQYPDPDRLRHHPQAAWPPGLWRRRARLPGHGHRAPVGEDRLRRVPQGGAATTNAWPTSWRGCPRPPSAARCGWIWRCNNTPTA